MVGCERQLIEVEFGLQDEVVLMQFKHLASTDGCVFPCWRTTVGPQ